MKSTRAPFQVLVFPFRTNIANSFEYCIFKRSKKSGAYWQAIAGGGEGKESFLEAAKREALEEAGIPFNREYIELDSRATIPVESVCGFKWGAEVFVIPEYCFGVNANGLECNISKEHSEFKWCAYEDCMKRLKWDSNRNALWELNLRLKRVGCNLV